MSAPCPEFGFIIRIKLKASASDQNASLITTDLISILEQNGLVVGRVGHRALDFVVSREGAQATHSDSELLMDWASRWTDEATISVSDLVDLSQFT